MITPSQNSISNRSFPEAKEFLLKEIVGPDYPVKHLIEQARNKGYITKGKPGRGGGIVTSRDMAILLIGTLAGDTPQAASDAMVHLSQLQPHAKHLVHDELRHFPLADNWWELSFIDAITQFIDVARNDFHFAFDEMSVRVIREPMMYVKIEWNVLPYERDEFLCYYLSDANNSTSPTKSHRTISASYNGRALIRVADWLEDRLEH
jgi:hypothetical protein